ncbi:hypothetical protein A2U01_0005700 [Trifolium medium]|uniref:Uncharacterized protein n=1 Tax=Trifolium medium TaxID=97028 RepID=A0A392MCI3_9FABA|nr:hypothetical protein [Trifolium medium]
MHIKRKVILVSDWAKAKYTRPKRSSSSPNLFLLGGTLIVTDTIVTVHYLQRIRTTLHPHGTVRSISTALIISSASCCQLLQKVIIVCLYIKASFGAKVLSPTGIHRT